MRSRPHKALALLLPVLVLIGCGSGGTTVGGGNRAPAAGSGDGGGSRPAAFDPRDAPLGCIQSKGIQVEKDPKQTDRLVILPAASGASIAFAATAPEAQSRQLSNEAPGAEVIGPHLLTVGDLSDAELTKIETCLQAQGSKY
jgi:hypothetical protein